MRRMKVGLFTHCCLSKFDHTENAGEVAGFPNDGTSRNLKVGSLNAWSRLSGFQVIPSFNYHGDSGHRCTSKNDSYCRTKLKTKERLNIFRYFEQHTGKHASWDLLKCIVNTTGLLIKMSIETTGCELATSCTCSIFH